MHRTILITICTWMLLGVAAYPADCALLDPGEFAFSADDGFGGGGSYLGVDTRDITPDRVAPLQLKDESGVEVTMVDQDAPAGKAGLQEHDVILTVNGEAVESVEQLRRLIREIPGGRVVSVGISRNGQPMTLKAQLAARRIPAQQFKFAMPAMAPIPPMPPMANFDIPISIVVVHSSMRSGLMVENLTSQLADFFGAKDGNGVLVRSVEKGSYAEKAGFHAGDVILRVNGESISDSGDFSHALRSGKDNMVRVGIIRDKKEQTLTLTLPERKQSDVLEEESFEMPEISALAKADMAKMKVEMAQIKPQIEKAMRAWQQQKPEIEKQMREINQKEIKDQMEHAKKMIEEQRNNLRRIINQGGGDDI